MMMIKEKRKQKVTTVTTTMRNTTLAMMVDMNVRGFGDQKNDFDLVMVFTLTMKIGQGEVNDSEV